MMTCQHHTMLTYIVMLMLRQAELNEGDLRLLMENNFFTEMTVYC